MVFAPKGSSYREAPMNNAMARLTFTLTMVENETTNLKLSRPRVAGEVLHYAQHFVFFPMTTINTYSPSIQSYVSNNTVTLGRDTVSLFTKYQARSLLQPRGKSEHSVHKPVRINENHKIVVS